MIIDFYVLLFIEDPCVLLILNQPLNEDITLFVKRIWKSSIHNFYILFSQCRFQVMLCFYLINLKFITKSIAKIKKYKRLAQEKKLYLQYRYYKFIKI